VSFAGGRAPWRLEAAQLTDLFCIAGITIASALPCLPRLGFYSDDWALLATFDSAARNGALAASVLHDFAARPVQGLYLASLFEIFGLDPLGYHIVNILVIAAGVCLFYLLLVRLHIGRAQSLAASLLFLMLPQLSTVRVWYSAFQIPFSLALMLVSMHAQLSCSRTGKAAWQVLAIVAAILSVAAYEIFAPLLAGFAAVLLVLWWRNSPRDSRSRWWVALSSAAAVALILMAIAYKLLLSGRVALIADSNRYLVGLRQLLRSDYDWRVDSGLNIFAMAQACFWAPVKGWWTGAASLASGRSGMEVVVLAIGIAAVCFWRLAARDPRKEMIEPKQILVLGIASFLLGQAVFLIVPYIAFTSTGIDNRTQVAAALGVALVFTAILELVAKMVPAWRHAFAAAVALISAAAFARLSTIENYWAEAPALQQRILSAARTDLRTIPANPIIIFDGVCPYYGPAIVFESWDAGSALSLSLHRPVTADVVSPRMSLTPKGLSTSIYKMPDFYPFSDRLYIYQPYQHRLVRLGSAAAAKAYFTIREANLCPVGYVARGVAV